MNSICTLYDQERNLAETVLCRDLRTPYGGDLYFPVAPAGRPYVVANFVSTLDGVVSSNVSGQAGVRRSVAQIPPTVSLWVCYALQQMPFSWGRAPLKRFPPTTSGLRNSFAQQQIQPTPIIGTR
jgi:hypothetical protein